MQGFLTDTRRREGESISAPKGHHAYDIEAITVKTETAEKGLPSGALSAKRIGTSAVSLLKVRDLVIGVNPESVAVKTDDNGEPPPTA